jgi:hypothetical protein
MGLWSAYFAIKLLFYAQGAIDFHVGLNLGFAAFTALEPANSRQRLAKNLIAVPVGVLLLYDDSYLPPLTVLLAQASLHLRLLAAFDWRLTVEAAAVLGLYELARRKLRLSTFVFIGILAVLLVPRGSSVAESTSAVLALPPAGAVTRQRAAPPNLAPGALDARLAAFYAQQAAIHLDFPRMAPDAVPYDIIILQVAALSWSDLRTIGQSEDPLFDRFDVLLTGFNSAATDPASAARRLERGLCGQPDEALLQAPAARDCRMLDALERAGFTAQVLPGSAADGAPADRDFARLSEWLARRRLDPTPRVALYTRLATLAQDDAADAPASYAGRFARFSGDLRRFLEALAGGGRHAIVVVVGENGAALAGDARQPPGLREIPTPAVTLVPAGVVLVNAAHRGAWVQQRVAEPTSYLALATLLARFVANDPFDTQDLSLADYVRDLPASDFVAVHGGATVLEVAQRFMVRSSDGRWDRL